MSLAIPTAFSKRSQKWSYPPLPLGDDEDALPQKTSIHAYIKSRELMTSSRSLTSRISKRHQKLPKRKSSRISSAKSPVKQFIDWIANDLPFASSSASNASPTKKLIGWMSPETKASSVRIECISNKSNASSPFKKTDWLTHEMSSEATLASLQDITVVSDVIGQNANDLTRNQDYLSAKNFICGAENVNMWAKKNSMESSNFEGAFAAGKTVRQTEQEASIKPQDAFSDYLVRKNVTVLREAPQDTVAMDKIFTSAWLSDTEVVLGTKCNKLVVLNLDSGKRSVIPSRGAEPQVEPVVGISHEDNTNLNFTDSDSDAYFNKPQCSGIHSVAINDSKTRLAVGYGKSSETIQIYRLPSFEPIALLNGHKDMVFSIQWLEDNVLVSGSRDKSVKLWSLPQSIDVHEDNVSIFNCVASKVEHRDKVRDLTLDKKLSHVYTLGADGCVKIWDARRSLGDSIRTVPLAHTTETVCMAIDPMHHVVTVGSQSHISLIDPRVGAVVQSFESLDEGWGVRSMNICNSLVTVGGGLGRISFYDLRSMAYLKWDTNEPQLTITCERPGSSLRQSENRLTNNRSWMEPSKGWLDRDGIYMNHFHGADIKNAIYTLAYDASGTRLFTAGGPLQLNLKGSYAGLWS